MLSLNSVLKHEQELGYFYLILKVLLWESFFQCLETGNLGHYIPKQDKLHRPVQDLTGKQ